MGIEATQRKVLYGMHCKLHDISSRFDRSIEGIDAKCIFPNQISLFFEMNVFTYNFQMYFEVLRWRMFKIHSASISAFISVT